MPLHITEDGESWTQNTIVMITYADTIEDTNSLPINSINKFLKFALFATNGASTFVWLILLTTPLLCLRCLSF